MEHEVWKHQFGTNKQNNSWTSAALRSIEIRVIDSGNNMFCFFWRRHSGSNSDRLGHMTPCSSENVHLRWTFSAHTYVGIITANHFSVRYLVTQAVGGLVGVDRHVQDLGGIVGEGEREGGGSCIRRRRRIGIKRDLALHQHARHQSDNKMGRWPNMAMRSNPLPRWTTNTSDVPLKFMTTIPHWGRSFRNGLKISRSFSSIYHEGCLSVNNTAKAVIEKNKLILSRKRQVKFGVNKRFHALLPIFRLNKRKKTGFCLNTTS